MRTVGPTNRWSELSSCFVRIRTASKRIQYPEASSGEYCDVWPIARQRISKQAFSTIERRYFRRGPCRRVIKGQKSRLRELFSRIWSSSGDSSRRWLRRNGKKEIRLCKEDFICDLKWELNCYKSVAWIRLVKTENLSACVTVKCKVCSSVIVL
jgi:hypothetical protein